MSHVDREALILDHLGYVKHILARLVSHLPNGVDIENLESAGVLGLIEASGQFDPTRKVEFKTFAYQRIRGAILDELRRNCPLSQQMLQKISVLREAREKIQGPVILEHLAAIAEMPVEEVARCIQAARLTRPEAWNESIQTRKEQAKRQTTAPIERQEMRQVLADGIEELPETMRLAVTLHYTEDLKLKEIGEILGLSESRVSRIVNAGKERLRDYVKTRGF